MIPNARYIHTNLIAYDWRTLANFYITVFGCEVASTERDVKGSWVDLMTGIKGEHIRGIHLRLPGIETGPTLEIFQYIHPLDCPNKINRKGFAHIAFKVEDVNAALNEIIGAGGSAYGEVVKQIIPGLGFITVVYATDPEGNIIELQHVKPE